MSNKVEGGTAFHIPQTEPLGIADMYFGSNLQENPNNCKQSSVNIPIIRQNLKIDNNITG